MLITLLDKFKDKFPGHSRCEIKNVFVLLLCIIEQETVCLNKLKKCVPKLLGNQQVTLCSHYQRLLRTVYTGSQSSLWEKLLAVIIGLFTHQVKYLVLDGTKWELGKLHIHLMTLSMVYKGVSIPICWLELGKKGHSHTKERMKLLKKACGSYDLSGKVLLADREYVGKDWIKYLQHQEIDFIIRLKKGSYKQALNRVAGDRWSKLEKKALRRRRAVGKQFILEGMELQLVMVKNTAHQAEEPLLYLLTSLENAQHVASAYRMRWLIEVCFRHAKTNGFHLEELHVGKRCRIEFLFAMVVIAYALAIHEGLKRVKQVKMKTHRKWGVFPKVSVFRNGLEHLSVMIEGIVLLLAYLLTEIESATKKYRSKKAIFYPNVKNV